MVGLILTLQPETTGRRIKDRRGDVPSVIAVKRPEVSRQATPPLGTF